MDAKDSEMGKILRAVKLISYSLYIKQWCLIIGFFNPRFCKWLFVFNIYLGW